MSRFRLLLLGMLAVFAAGAFASASAPAGPLHWYECLKHGGKTLLFTEKLCKTDKTKEGEWEWLKTPEGVLLLVDSLGGTQTWTLTAAGVNLTITCGHLDNEGTIENPVGGGAGVGLLSLLYLGCNVTPAALKCQIPEEMFSINTSGTLIGTNAAPAVLFTPDPSTSTTFFELKFEKCTNEGLNVSFKIQGDFLAKFNNSTSTLEYKEEKGKESMLKFAGNEGGLVGNDELLVAANGGAFLVQE